MISLYLSFFNESKFKRVLNLKNAYTYAERRVKYMLLTKNQLVLPVAHILNSPVASQLIMQNPILLKKQIIIPAIRDTVQDLDELVTEDKTILGHTYDALTIRTLHEKTPEWRRFSVQNTEGKIRERILSDLDNEQSLLNEWLKDKSDSIKQEILESETGHLPHHIGLLKKELNEEQLTKLNGYFDILYYVAGSNELNCECLIPQSNISPMFRLIRDSNILSNEAIFRDILLISIANVTSIRIATFFLENMSISQILEFRESSPYFDNFCEQFSNINRNCLPEEFLESTKKLIYKINELYELRNELEQRYEDALQKEMKIKTKLQKAKGVGNILVNALSPFLAPLGIISSLFQITELAINLMPDRISVHKHLDEIKSKLNKTSPFIEYAEELLNFQSKYLPQLVDESI